MLGVGTKFPEYRLTAVVNKGPDPKEAFRELSNKDFQGKWKVVFFWPKDFTFVCPTEIAAFGDMEKDFQSRNCQVLGASIDSEFVHMAWLNDNQQLSSVNFPLLSDIKRELSTALGIIDPNAGVSQRATFIVDPHDTIRFVSVTDLSVGRNCDEVLRVLDALQCGGLCPINWQKGKPTL